MLQGMLSSEQEEELEEATGAASVSGTTWYYNGTSTTDISATTNNTLCINFGKKAALSTSGLAGSFTITYTDANSNAATVVKSLDGGSFSSDYTSYYLNMAPVTAMLNGSTIPSGELAVQVKVSGFVCNEGSQAGRDLDAFKKTINVAPLYSSTTIAGVTFNTLYSTMGSSIEIPVNGTISLASDAALELSAASGSSLPTGLSANNFTVSASSDGKTILVTPSVEMNQKNFSAEFTVSGIIPALNGTEKSQTFPINFVGAIMSTSTTTNSLGGGLTMDMSSMTLSDDGSNLTVALSFNAIPSGWDKDRICVMIDDAAQSTTATVASNPATSYSVTNGTIDFYGYQALNSTPVNMTTANTWTQNSSSSSITVSGTTIVGWAYYADSSTVKYVIPFSSIGSGISTGSTIRVVAFATQNWSGGVYDDCPATAVTLSTTTYTNDTAAVDFNNGLSYTVGSAGETVTYPVPDALTLAVTGTTATTMSLAWTASYGATAYTLKKSTDGVTYTDLAASTTNLTYTDTGLSASTTYYYEVAATNSAGTSSYTTKTCKTSDFTVSAAAASYKSVKVSWDDIGATSYKVEYAVKADTPSYTTAASANTSTSYTITGLTAATTYYFRVTATMSTGDTVVNTATGKPYTVTLDGTLSDDEGWTDTNVAAVSTDTISSATAYDIKDMYITNDATNLYIAVEFNSIPTFWDGYHVTILLDNNASSTGGAATTSGGWGSGVATSVTISKGSVEAQITTNNGNTTTGTCGTSWTGDGNSGYVPATAVLEYSIPLSSVGSLATGNIVYAYAAVSVYGWVNSANETGVRDHVPAAAATLSNSATCDWVVNNIASIDMTSALSYTIK